MTKKQKIIFDFINSFIEENGYSPTVREIADGVGLKSPATVHTHISNLVDMGLLKKDALKNRTISSQTVHKDELFANDDKVELEEGINFLNVPVIGKVAAGEPILAVENILRTFPLPMDFAHNKEIFMLQVQGDSMINIGIMDGDYVIVERQNIANNGDVIVALIDDSATVKTFYKENGYFRLQPENDALDPIIVTSLVVLGKVVGVYRKM
ncbi:MAG: transcriptional repressor LexA [Clostridia bacterium]|nr:transcriptional repressor LexA [Clostridia bacterium]